MVVAERRLDFVLPPELEAREPPEPRGLARDAVRLLVTTREGKVEHARFYQLPEFLRPGDLVVVNDSATLPAAVPARRADGRELTLHFSTQLPAGLWVVEPRQTQPDAGEALVMPDGGAATLLRRYPHSQRLWVAALDLPLPVVSYLHRWGRPIVYSYVPQTWPLEMYQTVYAAEPGSAEMPSAGRPFSGDVIARLAVANIQMARLTLHTGVSSLENDEEPYAEYFHVPAVTAEAVQATRAKGGRVIAVGTTVVRALESAAEETGQVIASRGWTELVITPERGVRTVDGILTGFHEPAASHLAMLEAIAGRDLLERAYRSALDGGYLWHEFGDVHLIL